ncbi:MAG: hypothetical protein WCW27_04165 [Patescibacteria group bacterium]|jgi:hypothetical protein
MKKEISKVKTKWFTLNRVLRLTYVLVALIILLSATKLWLLSIRYSTLFDNATYQAVTLTNGQTFFGRLSKYGINTYVLTDVYYLQQTDTQAAATNVNTNVAADNTETADNSNDNLNSNDNNVTASGLSLKRLVDDVHKPYNYIVINRDQISFWQSLNPASPIIEAIKKGNQN